MDRKELESKKISDLRVIAQTIGIENPENYKKPELINLITGGSSPEIKDDGAELKSEKREANQKGRRKRTTIELNSESTLFSDAKKNDKVEAIENEVVVTNESLVEEVVNEVISSTDEKKEVETPVRPTTKPGVKPGPKTPYKPKPGVKPNPKAEKKSNIPDWLTFDELGLNILWYENHE